MTPDSGFSGGGFSDVIAMHNLRRGLTPPDCGRFNQQMWSDGLAMARRGSVTNGRGGIHAGQAVAAGVAVAVTGQSPDAILAGALAHVPRDSWTYRALHRAGEIAAGAMDMWATLNALHDGVTVLSPRGPILRRKQWPSPSGRSSPHAEPIATPSSAGSIWGVTPTRSPPWPGLSSGPARALGRCRARGKSVSARCLATTSASSLAHRCPIWPPVWSTVFCRKERGNGARAATAQPLPLAAAAVPLRAHPRLRLAAQALPRFAHRPARIVVDMPGLALVKVRAALDHGLLQLAARRDWVRVRQVLHDHIVDAVELPLRAGIGILIHQTRRLALVGPAQARPSDTPARRARERGLLRVLLDLSRQPRPLRDS